MARGLMGESTTQAYEPSQKEKGKKNSVKLISRSIYIAVTNTTDSNTVIKTCFWYAQVEHHALHVLP